MNLLKSFFISFVITYWLALTLYAGFLLYSGGNGRLVLALMLAGGVPFAFFVVLMGWRPSARIADSGLHIITLAILAGMLILFYDGWPTTASSWWVFAVALSQVLWMLYVYWYSRLPAAARQWQAGERLPELTFNDIDGQPVTSKQWLGKKVLYMFYRGNWCPLCMAQIKEIAAGYRQLHAAGVQVVLVSPQPAGYSRQLAHKYDAGLTFLVDEDNRMARKLGIAHAFGTPAGMQALGYDSATVLPTVLLVDEEGQVMLAAQTDNYRLRPEPEIFLQLINNR